VRPRKVCDVCGNLSGTCSELDYDDVRSRRRDPLTGAWRNVRACGRCAFTLRRVSKRAPSARIHVRSVKTPHKAIAALRAALGIGEPQAR